MRTRKPLQGKVTGIKFTLNKEKEEDDLKKVKEQLLKELEEREKADKEWYDKKMDENLKKK